MGVTSKPLVIFERDVMLERLRGVAAAQAPPYKQVPGDPDSSYNSRIIQPSPNKPGTTMLNERGTPEGEEEEEEEEGEEGDGDGDGDQEDQEDQEEEEEEEDHQGQQEPSRRVGLYFPYY